MVIPVFAFLQQHHFPWSSTQPIAYEIGPIYPVRSDDRLSALRLPTSRHHEFCTGPRGRCVFSKSTVSSRGISSIAASLNPRPRA